VRLVDQTLFFEARKNIPHRRGRQVQIAVLREPGRRYRLALFDVLGDKAGQDSPLALAGFHAHAISTLGMGVLGDYSRYDRYDG
jgi:hypothetical protein